MARLTKYIFILALVTIFVYIAYTSILASMATTEGFKLYVRYARDCSCNPGYIPQLCGDPINNTPLDNCVNDTYFCQKLTTPYDKKACNLQS